MLPEKNVARSSTGLSATKMTQSVTNDFACDLKTAGIPEGIVIRWMRESDLDQVCAIEKDTFAMPWKRQDFQQALLNKNCLYVAALYGQKVIGYCGLYRSFEEADLVNVTIAACARRHGIGEKMLRFLMKEGRRQGIERFTLEVRAGNTAAIRLYEKLGFECVGYRKQFYSLPTEDAAIMWTKTGAGSFTGQGEGADT